MRHKGADADRTTLQWRPCLTCAPLPFNVPAFGALHQALFLIVAFVLRKVDQCTF